MKRRRTTELLAVGGRAGDKALQQQLVVQPKRKIVFT